MSGFTISNEAFTAPFRFDAAKVDDDLEMKLFSRSRTPISRPSVRVARQTFILIYVPIDCKKNH
jgi:hypothetical protein